MNLPHIPELGDKFPQMVAFLDGIIWGDIPLGGDAPVGDYYHSLGVGQYEFEVSLFVAKGLRVYRILLADHTKSGRVVAIGSDCDPQFAIRALLVDPNVRRMVRAWMGAS